MQREREPTGILIIPSGWAEVSSKWTLSSLKPQVYSFTQSLKLGQTIISNLIIATVIRYVRDSGIVVCTFISTYKWWIFFSPWNFIYSTLHSKQLPALLPQVLWNALLSVIPSATTVPYTRASQHSPPLAVYARDNYVGRHSFMYFPKKNPGVSRIFYL